MDPIPFPAPPRSGAPLAKDCAAPDGGARRNDLTGALAAFAAVFTGRTPASDSETQDMDILDHARADPVPDISAVPLPGIADPHIPKTAASIGTGLLGMQAEPDAKASSAHTLMAETPGAAFGGAVPGGHARADRNHAPNQTVLPEMRTPEPSVLSLPWAQEMGETRISVTVAGQIGGGGRVPLALDPSQTTAPSDGIDADATASAAAGDRATTKPAPDRPMPIHNPVTDAVARNTVEGPAPVDAAPETGGHAAGGAPAVTAATPVPLAAYDPADPLTADTNGTLHGEVAGTATGADSVPSPRAEQRQAHVTQVLPHGLGQRLAETIAQFPDRPVEVTLSPEELGRVRMSLSTHDGALTMSVLADRPETLDLLRRNIDQLAQDFRDLGFHDLSFSFGDRRSPHFTERIGAEAGGEDDRDGLAASATRARPMRAAPAADGGLDLRL